MGKKLVDFSLTGKQKPWKEKKLAAREFADSFRRLGKFMQADSMYGCGDTLIFDECDQGHRKLKKGYFCKVRMCPYCSWRRSRKIADQVMKVASVVNQAKKVRWLFLTLTIRNCQKDELQETITRLMQAFNRLNTRKFMKDYCFGWFRALEVTRNNEIYRKDKHRNWIDNEWYDTMHPHFHVLLAMKPSYFSKSYLSKEEWAKIWGQCLQVDYVPNIGIETVKDKRKDDRLRDLKEFENQGIFDVESKTDLPAGVIAEVAKYTLKDNEVFNDYNPWVKEVLPLTIEEIDDNVHTLFGALSKRRLYAYGGFLKEVHKELQLVEPDELDDNDQELEHKDECSCPICQSSMKETLYSWLPGYGNYYQIENEKLIKKILYHEQKKNNPEERRVIRKYNPSDYDNDSQ